MLTKVINNKEEFLNKKIEIIGFVSKIRNLGNKIFIDLRNIDGIIQLVIVSEKKEVANIANDLGNEYVVKAKGYLKTRKSINKNIVLGDVEIDVDDLEIISKAITTPLIINDITDALEEVRYKYRYLDLRRPNIANIFKLRSKVYKIIHNFFDDNDFIEIETPILTKATPEGARDYLIPSRIHPNKNYALPQSPQIYKQLLMVAGFERYYQIARCFRDEDLRKDRQPEFTQLDMEISNVQEEYIYNLIEKLIYKIFKKIKNFDIKTPFEKITYNDAINNYGSDKPDTRYELQLKDVTSIMKKINLEVFNKAKTIKMLCFENYNYTNKDIKKFQEIAKTYKIENLFYTKYANYEFNSGISKFLSKDIKKNLINIIKDKDKNLIILFSAGEWIDSCISLGEIRKYIAKDQKLYKENQFSFNWIVDWPLFEYDLKNKKYSPMHHPFTSFKEESKEDFNNGRFDKVISRAYDIVVNGYELGGGSIRVTDPIIQKKIMNIIGLDDKTIKEKFSTIIEAYSYGSPIHGGIALGLDRLMMILSNTKNITDVIAFPKTLSAKELMLDTPS